MDTLSHGLWAAVAAKAANKILRKHGNERRVSPWWAGFWGVFPDLLSFTPLFFWTLSRILTGVFSFNDFGSLNPSQYQATVITPLTSALYGLTHSAVVFVPVFVLAWLIFRRPIWELGGWLLHLLVDIPSHPTASYPTPLLWPFSELHIGGISWATPTFLIANYAVLGILLYLLREKEPRPAEPVSPRTRTFRVIRNVVFTAFVVVIAFSIYAALHARRGQEPPLAMGNPAANANIIITAPQPGATVGLPLIITGKARAFENTFSYRVRESSVFSEGAILYESNAMTDASDAGILGNFSLSVNYPAPHTDHGMVEVFEYSAKDGAEINKVSVPIVFEKDPPSQTVNAYFSSRAEDPEAMECNKTYPAPRRIPKTSAPAHAALEELLKGPDYVEADNGFFTSINPGVKINSLAVANGVARVDFNETMETGMGGSCRVAAIRSQITNTLKQFPSVQEVVIGVEGRVEDALQP